MSLFDIAGLVGVLLILSAYAAAQLHWLEATKPPALLMNLIGAGLILSSLTRAFNLSAAVMEGAWALIALIALARRLLGRH